MSAGSIPPGGSSGSPKPIARIQAPDYKKVELLSAVGGVYRHTPKSPSYHNFAGPAIGLISDHNSQYSQFAQALTGYANSSNPPPGLLSYNSLSKSAIQLIEWGDQNLKYAKSFYKALIDDKLTVGDKFKIFIGYNLTWSDRLAYLQKTSYLAYNVCAGSNLVKNVISYFNNQAISQAVSDAFKKVGIGAGSALAIFSGLRAIKAIGEYYKAKQYKSLLGRCTLPSEKMAALKSLIFVSDEEILGDNKDLAEKKAYLSACFKKLMPEQEQEAMKLLGTSKKLDLSGLIEKLADPSVKAAYVSQLGISEQTLEGLSPEEITGFILMKEQLTLKKKEKLMSTLTNRASEGERLVNAITTLAKTQSVSNVIFNNPTHNQEIEKLFSQVQQMTNRKLLKEGAIIVSCILTIIASITTIVCPAAFPLIIVMWVLSNAIEFGLSMQEFADAAKEKELHPDPVYPKATNMKQWWDQSRSWSKDNWRTIISVAVNVVAVALVIASLCTNPITGPVVAVAIASLLAVALYSYFNACLLHKASRDRLVKTADYIDRYINKNIARFFGIDIETEQELKKSASEIVSKSTPQLLEKDILTLNLRDKFEFYTQLHTKGKLVAFPDFRILKPTDREIVLRNLDMMVKNLIAKEPDVMNTLFQSFSEAKSKRILQHAETYMKTA